MPPDNLVLSARRASESARVPFSHFPVGAAVEGDDGRTYVGCNIESHSYGLTVCAERVAIFNAISAGATPVRIAVSCPHASVKGASDRMPCGACRQVMLDQMGPNGLVIVDEVGEFSVSELLPSGFRLSD